MWQSQHTFYNRLNGDVKSALQKFCRRGLVNESIACCLEFLKGNNGKAALQRLLVISVEDKFPEGCSYIKWFNDKIKHWKKIENKSEVLINAAASIASCKSDRHAAWLARVAIHNAAEGITPTEPEELMATRVEKRLLRMKKKNEIDTPNDKEESDLFNSIFSIIFDGKQLNKVESELWNVFRKTFTREATLTSRLYLYTLIGLQNHGYKTDSKIPAKFEYNESGAVELPDYVFDKHTKAGKRMGRGLKHFIEVGAYVSNPHEDISKRSGVKRKAEQIYLEDESKYGTKYANSRAVRRRVRKKYQQLKYWKGKKILSSVMGKKPCGEKPASWIFDTGDEKVFVKGPFSSQDKLKFQLQIDGVKEKYGIKPVGYKVFKMKNIYYLHAPVYKGKLMDPSLKYTDQQLMELMKILIFRGAHGCSDTHLRNIMVLDDYSILSVDEMSENKRKPKCSLYDFLFSKKPNSKFRKVLDDFISTHHEVIANEFEKYGLNFIDYQ